MLSYIVPAEDKRSFSNQGDEFAALSQEDGSSPIAKARPLLNIAVLHNNKAPTPRDNLMTANPAGNTSPPGGVRQQQKQELFLSRVVENGDRSPVMSESRSVGSDLVLTPGSDDKSIVKSTSAKPNLKRVSFGSSKGSMVETLIYESPVAEEDRIPEEDAPITDPVAQKFTAETAEPQKPASKVRVTFFESEKPLAVTSPEPDFFGPSFCDFATMSSPAPDAILAHTFDRQLSSENGKDNPFRPDGDISREADEIVQLIKSGRPLDSSLTSPDGLAKDTPDSSLKKSSAGANGSAPSTSPGPVEVKHATVTPSASAQVEHVVLKKKSKCGCCVIQ